MKKTIIIFISLIIIIAFLALVYYGLRHARGIPVKIEKPEKVILEAPFIDKDIDLIKGISEETWESIAAQEVKLMYQLMVLPWPKSITASIFVKAFYNQKDIYFYISWRDDTQDKDLGFNKFSDACAIMFALGREIQPPTIMMGFLGKANIWHWKASQDKEYWLKETVRLEAYSDFYYPFEEEEVLVVSRDIPQSAVNDLIAIRVGTVTPKETQNIQGRGFWQDGIWQVVFKRSLKAFDPEVDADFAGDKKLLCAFAVWNGSRGDRGGRKSISDWVELEIE